MLRRSGSEMRGHDGRRRWPSLLAPVGFVVVAMAIVVASCTSSESSSDVTSATTPDTAVATPWVPVTGQPLVQPEVLSSVDGRLEVDLRAEMGVVDVAGSPIGAMPYNEMFNGPTFQVQPGDTLRVTLDNGTDEHTNIHYHGLHVSPSGDGDNVLRMMDPGTVNVSQIEIPADHETGLFWYHAHMHGNTDPQVYGGMRGLIVVGDLVGTHLPPEFAGIAQPAFSINDAYDKDGVVANKASSMSEATLLINNQSQPMWSIAPGETQLWRFANTGSDLFYQLALEGFRFWVVAEDGSPVWNVTETDVVVLPPGKRLEVLVQGGAPGERSLVTQAIQVGPGAGNAQPEMPLATVRVEGPPVAPLAIPTTLLGPRTEDLSQVAVDRSREFTFTLSATGDPFGFINGEAFDPDKVNVEVGLGAVEEWTLKNPDTGSSTTSANHPFHIHVNDFQVMSVNGAAYEANGLQDIVVIPSGGEVVIRQRYTDFTGEFVFHCHILPHEDGGMMQTVKVIG